MWILIFSCHSREDYSHIIGHHLHLLFTPLVDSLDFMLNQLQNISKYYLFILHEDDKICGFESSCHSWVDYCHVTDHPPPSPIVFSPFLSALFHEVCGDVKHSASSSHYNYCFSKLYEFTCTQPINKDMVGATLIQLEKYQIKPPKYILWRYQWARRKRPLVLSRDDYWSTRMMCTPCY